MRRTKTIKLEKKMLFSLFLAPFLPFNLETIAKEGEGNKALYFLGLHNSKNETNQITM